MKTLKVHSDGAYYFGSDGPIIRLRINDRPCLYTQVGLEALIEQYRAMNVDTHDLEGALLEILASKHLPLPDLSLDALAGQMSLEIEA